ncbi:MAG: IPT/TIG domain-containing protein [Cyclobacteriaceae bacterium]|nr:IPT/TIG domain-containing protein [Cyclobacteriaceae bacterium]
MHKRVFSISITFVCILLLIKCDNYEFPKSPYPKIETLPVVNISKTGVTFQANITQQGKLPIVSHGFVWSNIENPTINSQDKVQLGPTSKLGNFEATVQSGLTEGETYYVRAFIATAEYFVYGENESFVSKGSTPPIIKALSSIEGTAADTVEIKGKYFSALAENNKVKFGQETSIVLTSTDSTIQCIVPNLTANQDYSISVNVAGNLTTSEIKFHVLQPKIESMTPMVGIFGDIITLNGENFPIKKDYINLTLDGIACEVLNVSKSAISFALPNNLIKSHIQVIAKISMVNVSAGVLTVSTPTIDNITNSVLSMYTNPALVISGNNFNPITAKNEVKIGGYSCNILSSSLTQLTIEAPREIIPDVDLSVQDTFDIEVKVLDQSVSIENKIAVTYLSRWTRMKDFPGNPRFLGLSFAVNGKGYIGLGSAEEYSTWYNDLWEYEPAADTWTQLSDFPGQARAKFTTLVIGSKIYIVGGITGHNSNGLSDDIKEVWEFDSNAKVWSKKNDFPGDPRANAFGFVLGNTAYYGGGNSSISGPRDDFWKYNSHTDSWIQLKSIPSSVNYPSSINSDDIFALSNGIDGYILTDNCGYSCRFFWKYDKVNDSWLDVSYMPGPNDEVTGFSLNGKFYVGTGMPWGNSFFEFDISMSTWSNKDFKGSSRRKATSFVLGNYGYLLLGQAGCHCANLHDVWRFDPSKP